MVTQDILLISITNKTLMKVSVFGIGKLGISFGAGLASEGHSVVGVDVNENLVESVNEGIAPFPEPGLQEHIDEYGDQLRATTDYSDAVQNSSVSVIFVPTPSQDDGSFDNRFVEDVLEGIATELREKDEYHLVVLSSTVSPGSMREFEALVEERSGKTCGEDLGLCYNPSFIAQGTIIRDFLNPEILLIGESDEEAGDRLIDFWNTILGTDPVVSRMNYINAEMAKITFNVFSTMKISFANQMAMLCGQHDGANVDTVMDAIKHDERVGGKKLFTGGLGYGGPCLPRDNGAFREFADLPSFLDIEERTDGLNDALPGIIEDVAEELASKDTTFGVLGLTYKPGTHITRESQALEIAHNLAAEGYEVLTYDPMAGERNCESVDEVLNDADVILSLTPWPEFEDLTRDQLADKKVFDAWRIHADELSDKDDYYAFGVDAPTSIPETVEARDTSQTRANR